MQRAIVSNVVSGLLLFCCAGVLVAAEADELRERAKALRKEAAALAEQGNKEQAERLEKESAKLLEAAERHELKAKGGGEQGDRARIEQEVRQIKERLQELVAKQQALKEAKGAEKDIAEIGEQIAQGERALREIKARYSGHGELRPELQAPMQRLAAAGRRIQHLRIAAENLKLAEAHDLAHQVLKQAESMERDVQEAKRRLTAEMHKAHGGDHGPGIVQEMRAEIERLRAEVKELRQQVEKR